MFSCAAEPRFSYCLYVPTRVHAQRLLLAVHGTDRDVFACREAFVDLADETDTVVVAPLFPADVGGRPDLDGYKYLEHDGLRYDIALDRILDEARTRVGLAAAPIVAWGFSGGAQMVQRYGMLYPDRVRAVALGAPGRVTRLVPLPWWQGIADADAIFGRDVDIARLRRSSVHIAVGDIDLGPLRALAGEAGTWTTRVERMRRFTDHLRSLDIPVELTVVPGAGHELLPLALAARTFLRQALLDVPGC